jgi:hypothetical protein
MSLAGRYQLDGRDAMARDHHALATLHGLDKSQKMRLGRMDGHLHDEPQLVLSLTVAIFEYSDFYADAAQNRGALAAVHVLFAPKRRCFNASVRPRSA